MSKQMSTVAMENMINPITNSLSRLDTMHLSIFSMLFARRGSENDDVLYRMIFRDLFI
jgi:hypothetical protein